MTETIATGLVYIHRPGPTKKFIGCGALIEGPYIATCRHVWRDATNAGKLSEVEIEYPRSGENGATIRTPARLADACENPDRVCDLVLLQPETIPPGALILQLARHETLEIGSGFALARVLRTDPMRGEVWRDLIARGQIDSIAIDNLRQFTGIVPQGFWFTPGSSGSPVFLQNAQQLAGILSLSELGANEGETHLREAFVVPATVIWSFVAKRLAQPIAAKEGVDPQKLQPVLDALGIQDVPIGEIPDRLTQAIAEMRARAAEPVPQSNDGSDIDATIGAARARLGDLDTAGARSVLAEKIAEEEAARHQRLIPLLEEQAAIERLSYDHAAAQATLRRLLELDPDRVWPWIDLGDSCATTGSLPAALQAYGEAETAARRTGDERDLSVSHNRIGDVQRAQGDLTAALTSYRAALAIGETLARADPGNAGWQRDLIVSCVKIADSDPEAAPALLARALDIARQLQTSGRLAPVDAWMPDDLARRLAQSENPPSRSPPQA